MKKIVGFLLGVMIGCVIMIPILSLKKENDKLRRENVDLEQQVIDYKWQIEQVPYIIEYGCNGR